MAVFFPGGLFRPYYGKSQEESWNPCQLHQGTCRNACTKYELQYLTCLNHEKCCLKFFVKVPSANHVKQESNSNSSLSVTMLSNYSQSWMSPALPTPPSPAEFFSRLEHASHKNASHVCVSHVWAVITGQGKVGLGAGETCGVGKGTDPRSK